eukprot:m.400710 g.400710  ORF g.400710 m.400710 type:complete len:128 (+) comp21163_c0_seq6:168-551(+)
MPSSSDYAVAFALTTGAGLATSIGAAAVFIPGFQQQKWLGISLAFAAGVMLYVSFVEIFFKALGSFEEYYDDKNGVDLASVTVEEYESDPNAYVRAVSLVAAWHTVTCRDLTLCGVHTESELPRFSL